MFYFEDMRLHVLTHEIYTRIALERLRRGAKRRQPLTKYFGTSFLPESDSTTTPNPVAKAAIILLEHTPNEQTRDSVNIAKCQTAIKRESNQLRQSGFV